MNENLEKLINVIHAIKYIVHSKKDIESHFHITDKF